MSDGLRAEVFVGEPATCPAAALSAEDAAVRSVSRAGAAGEQVTEEVTVEGRLDEAGFEEVFAYGDERVYRFSREAGVGCVCEHVERHGSTVRGLRPTDGSLVVTFLATDVDSLRTVMTDLRESFDGVRLRRLTRSERPEGDGDLAFVDREELTDRQREVLETAHEMGYFDHPREANAGEVADRLDISRSTFTEHLAAAQSKLLEAVLSA